MAIHRLVRTTIINIWYTRFFFYIPIVNKVAKRITNKVAVTNSSNVLMKRRYYNYIFVILSLQRKGELYILYFVCSNESTHTNIMLAFIISLFLTHV